MQISSPRANIYTGRMLLCLLWGWGRKDFSICLFGLDNIDKSALVVNDSKLLSSDWVSVSLCHSRMMSRRMWWQPAGVSSAASPGAQWASVCSVPSGIEKINFTLPRIHLTDYEFLFFTVLLTVLLLAETVVLPACALRCGLGLTQQPVQSGSGQVRQLHARLRATNAKNECGNVAVM